MVKAISLLLILILLATGVCALNSFDDSSAPSYVIGEDSWIRHYVTNSSGDITTGPDCNITIWYASAVLVDNVAMTKSSSKDYFYNYVFAEDWIYTYRVTCILGSQSSSIQVFPTTITADRNTIYSDIQTISNNVDSILTDTGTTIPSTITTLTNNVEEVNQTTHEINSTTHSTNTIVSALQTSMTNVLNRLNTAIFMIINLGKNMADYGQRQNYNWFINGTNEDAFKANVSGIDVNATEIANCVWNEDSTSCDNYKTVNAIVG